MMSRAARVALVMFAACGGNDNPGSGIDAPVTPDASPDAPPLAAGTVAVTLTSVDAITYLAPLSLGGTQHQNVIVDTGSTTLAVAGSTCSNCGVDPLYTPGTGAVDKHKTASGQYGDGTGWNGEIFADTIAIGAASTVQVSFASITTSNGFFRSFDGGPVPYQGIMGLGPDQILEAGTTSYVTSAVAAGMKPVMAFQLCPDTGTMWLGGVDPAAEATLPVATPLVSGFPFYGVHVDDIAVGSVSLGVNQAGFGPTIIDTGTSISFIPKAALTKLESKISADPGYQSVFGTQALTENACMSSGMNASQIDAALPPLHITFGGSTATPADLPATKSYLIAMGVGTWCFAFGDSSQLFGSQLTASLYGDSLLASMTTTFDIGNNQMTFAGQAGCSEANFAPDVARPAPHYSPDMPWWKQEPRLRLPSPEALQRRLSAP